MYVRTGFIDPGKLPTPPRMEWCEDSGYETSPVTGFAFDRFRAAIEPLIPGEWVRATLFYVKPDGVIHRHIDERNDPTRRYHVVLDTNPHCWTYHGGAMQQLAYGGIYSIDETQEHAAVNWGDTDRVHLAVDVRQEHP